MGRVDAIRDGQTGGKLNICAIRTGLFLAALAAVGLMLVLAVGSKVHLGGFVNREHSLVGLGMLVYPSEVFSCSFSTSISSAAAAPVGVLILVQLLGVDSKVHLVEVLTGLELSASSCTTFSFCAAIVFTLFRFFSSFSMSSAKSHKDLV